MIEAQANVFGRIAAVGATYRVEVVPVLDRLTLLAPELQQFVRIAVPHTFDRVAVTTAVARNAVDRVRELCDPEQLARLERLIAGETKELSIELETVPGSDAVVTALHAFGKRSIDDDLQHLAALGMTDATRGALREVVVALAGDHHYSGLSDRAGDPVTWRCHVAQRNRDQDERDATRARVLAVGAQLGVTEAQRNVITGLHDALARTHNSYAAVTATRDALVRELAVSWQNVPWEQVVRMMIGFFPGADAAARLGELAGAAGTETASVVELVLRTEEPPHMRIAVIPTS